MSKSAKKTIPFFRPDISEKDVASVVEALTSGWITSGPKVLEFEEKFQGMFDGKKAIAVNSATAGLHLAVEALGLGPGDEVIVPSMTFTSTAEVVRYVHATPVFCDIDPGTYCLSLETVQAVVTPKTKAIILVHFGGMPVDLTPLIAFCKERDIHIIEDAAHALPTYLEGKLIGQFDTAATVYSFYANKTITTGEGGMILTSDEALYNRMKVMRLHGMDYDAYDRFTTTKAVRQYDIVDAGFKYNLTDIAASLGVSQLDRAFEFNEKRAYIDRFYRAELANVGLVFQEQSHPTAQSSNHLFLAQVPDGVDRDQFRAKMLEQGVGSSLHYLPLHLTTYWGGYCNTPLPHTEKYYERTVSLPNFTALSDEDLEYIIGVIKASLDSC